MVPDMQDRGFRWSLVVPVKVLALAKSRLTGLTGVARPELALAMARDTVAAALACPQAGAVIVVTDDATAAEAMSALGAVVVPDEPAAGLNPALAFGAEVAARRWPAHGRAALAADLPALSPAALGRALTAARAHPQAFVADAAGRGTTLYTAAPGIPFIPKFGPGSRSRHLAGGAVELDLDGLDGLRRDVDTRADLLSAARVGLGPRTAALAAAALA